MRTLYLKQLLLILALSVGPAESARAQALQVTEVTQFDWGRLIDANTTLAMDTNDTITSDPNGVHIGGTVQSGVYTVTGGPNCKLRIRLNGVLTNNIKVRSPWVTNPAVINPVWTAADGTLTFTVGSELRVRGGAVPGIDQLTPLRIRVNYKGGGCSGASSNDYIDTVVDIYAVLGVAETTELDFGSVTDQDGTITLGLADTITSDPEWHQYGWEHRIRHLHLHGPGKSDCGSLAHGLDRIGAHARKLRDLGG